MVPTVANPIRMSESPIEYDRAPPVLGQHTDEVLGELIGLDGAAIAKLREDGIV
jgi:crotonobetainyl-CoA:carnitine CoA-transferase CaiB-like acyl-CoA transferase